MANATGLNEAGRKLFKALQGEGFPAKLALQIAKGLVPYGNKGDYSFSHLFLAVPEAFLEDAAIAYLKKKGYIDEEAVAALTALANDAKRVRRIVAMTKGMGVIERIFAIAPEALTVTTIDFLRARGMVTSTQAQALRLALRAGGVLTSGGLPQDRAEIILRVKKLFGVGASEELIVLLRSMDFLDIKQANAMRAVLLGGDWSLETIKKLRQAKGLTEMMMLSGRQIVDRKLLNLMKLTGLINTRTANAMIETLTYAGDLWTVWEGAKRADGLAARMAYTMTGSFNHQSLAFLEAMNLITPEQKKLLRIAVQISQAYNRILMEKFTKRRYRVFTGESPIATFARASKQTEAALLRLLAEAARDAHKEAKALGVGNLTGAQKELRAKALHNAMREVWEGTGYLTIAGEAEVSAAALQATDDLTKAYKRLPDGDFVREMLHWQAQSGLDSYISRQENTQALASRVYGNWNLFNGKVDKIINKGLLAGKSADEIARSVSSYIRPTALGGVSYAARRLARTELANAFHQTTIRHSREMPWVTGYKWNRSSSHGHQDICDQYATEDHDDLGPGIYKKANVPGKPHPQCLCYLTLEEVDEDHFIRNMKRGYYDRYLNTIVTDQDVAINNFQKFANQTIKIASTAASQVALTAAFSLGAKAIKGEGIGNFSFNPTKEKIVGYGKEARVYLAAKTAKLKAQGVKFRLAATGQEVPADILALANHGITREQFLLQQRAQLLIDHEDLLLAEAVARAKHVTSSGISSAKSLQARMALASGSQGRGFTPDELEALEVSALTSSQRKSLLDYMATEEYNDILPARDPFGESFSEQYAKGMYGSFGYRVINGRLRLTGGDLAAYNNSFKDPDFIDRLGDITDFATQQTELNELLNNLQSEPLNHPTMTHAALTDYTQKLLTAHLPANKAVHNFPETGWLYHSDIVRALDNSMLQIPKDMELFRATGHDFFGLGRELSASDVGLVFKDDAFTSFEGIPNYYSEAGPVHGLNLTGRSVRIKMLAPKNTLATRINDFEHEILMSRGSSYQVTGFKEENGLTFVEMVLLAQSEIEVGGNKLKNAIEDLYPDLT